MIILMGVAGAGKSYQGRLMADECGFSWISTGEILRVLITGSRRKEMLLGKLLSDGEVINVVDKVLELVDTKQEFVVDGFPRTIPQADWLLSQVNSGRLSLTAVFNLEANRDTVKGRLLKRGRQDDTDDAIVERFREYEQSTLPILQHFKTAGINVHTIDASGSPELIHEEIVAIVNNCANNVH